MASQNPFDLLVDDDSDDISQLLQKLPPPPPKKSPPPATAAQMPSKPLPPSQAVRGARTDGQRGGGRTGGREAGRGSGGRFNRDYADNGNSFGNSNNFSGGYRRPEGGEVDNSSERRGYGGPRGAFREDRRGSFSNGDAADGERPRRQYERHSGNGRGNEFVKRDGAGQGNWGAPADAFTPETEGPVDDGEKNVDAEKQGKQDVEDASKENPVTEQEQKEPEIELFTLEEYEKKLEEKRKALLALKSEERKVDLDKDFESMQLLSSKKKNDEEIFVKLGSDKDKRKEATEKEEKARKALSINEFLKPAEGERYQGPRGRGRGRGQGSGGGYTGFSGSNIRRVNNFAAPKIEDVKHFPSLGAK